METYVFELCENNAVNKAEAQTVPRHTVYVKHNPKFSRKKVRIMLNGRE